MKFYIYKKFLKSIIIIIIIIIILKTILLKQYWYKYNSFYWYEK